VQALFAIQHVLQRVVGRIAVIGLGIDNQPRLALSSEDVLGMEIGAEHDFALGARREIPEQRDSVARQSRIHWVAPGWRFANELVAPLIAHDRERPEGVARGWITPETAE